MKPKQLKHPFSFENRQVMINDGVLYVPPYVQDYSDFKMPSWKEIFGNENPVSIEYCSGNGRWIADKAKAYPEINWVAVEIRFDRVRKIWAKKQNLNLDNLFIVCGEGVTVSREYFTEASVQETFVNFPDPWPKERHAKHRIIQEPFVEQMGRILKPEGQVTLVTDDPTYSRQMVEVMRSRFRSLYPEPFYLTDDEDYGESYFRDLWLSKGRNIYFHRFTPVNEVKVDLGITSNLNWKELSLPEGKIVWKLEMGLFKGLKQPLSDQAQFQALSFALEEFERALLQPNKKRTAGIVLFEGSADFSKELTWDLEQEAHFREWLDGASEESDWLKRQFTRDICVDFLEVLGSLLPAEIPLILRLRSEELPSHETALQELNKERFQHFELEGVPRGDERSAVGVLLPAEENRDETVIEQVARVIKELEEKGCAFRVIPENFLTMEWEQLDQLLVAPAGITPQGERKLQGFEAAGGEILWIES